MPILYSLLLSETRMDPNTGHWAIQSAPACLECGCFMFNYNCSKKNPLGNAGRPCYICKNCNKFSCFGDMRGIHMNNPPCYCEGLLFSRLQISGSNNQQIFPSALHYTCAVGGCNFFCYVTNEHRAVCVYLGPIHGATYMASIGL